MTSVRYILKRSAFTVLLLFLVLSGLFVFFRLLSGSYADILIAQGASPEAAAALEAKWGLNDPVYIQYINYITNFATGDVGTSFRSKQPVLEYIKMPLFNSFILIAPAITAAYIIGSAYGVVAGLNRGSILEKYGIIAIIFAGAFPSFFMAIFLIFIFAGVFNIFPTGGMWPPGFTTGFEQWWQPYLTTDFAWHYILPFVAVILRYLFFPSLIMRTNVIELSNQGFVQYYRLSGLPRFTQLKRMTKHAILPVITLYPVSMTRAIGGLVLIEVVFNWPGVGNLLVQSVFSRDFPVLQFLFFLIAAWVIIANFAVDLIYTYIDPRIEVGS